MGKDKSRLSIKVTSEVSEVLPIHFLNPLQGTLKDLPDESYGNLKASILKHGFLFPFFIWENSEDGLIYVIDGHQRLLTLNKMKEEGYTIPQVPVILIKAESIKDAKSKLAAVASQYGKFNAKGVSDFFKELDIPEISFVEMPYFAPIKMEKSEEEKTTTVSSHERSISNTGKEIDLGDFENFEHKCPKCSFEWNE